MITMGAYVCPWSDRQISRWQRENAAMAKLMDPGILNEFRSQAGVTLGELCTERPLLLIFLRHFG